METIYSYYSLEGVAAKLHLPQKFIRTLAEEGKIPHLIVGGRMRFNPAAVQAALDRLAEQSQSQEEHRDEQ